MPATLNKHAEAILSDIQLMEGEQVEYCVQGDGMLADVKNPMVAAFAKLFAAIQVFLVTITGGHMRIFLVVTTYRVLLLQSNKIWCGLFSGRSYKTISSSSVLEAGTGKGTVYCCIHSRQVHIQSKTEEITLIVKKLKDADLQEFLTQLSILIISNTSSSSSPS